MTRAAYVVGRANLVVKDASAAISFYAPDFCAG